MVRLVDWKLLTGVGEEEERFMLVIKGFNLRGDIVNKDDVFKLIIVLMFKRYIGLRVGF